MGTRVGSVGDLGDGGHGDGGGDDFGEGTNGGVEVRVFRETKGMAWW